MHQHTVQCKNEAERKQRRLAEEEEREVISQAFGTYGLPLDIVTSFRYLVRVILAADDYWTAVIRNIAKA